MDSNCQTAFQELKKEAIQATKLCHYNTFKIQILARDASQNGIGAMLML